MMQVVVVTLFPAMFAALSEGGITGRAIQQGILGLTLCNPRDFTQDRHRRVDDRPYGGGPGMVMIVQPLRDALRSACERIGTDAWRVFLSPQGKPVTQERVEALAKRQALVLVCGRYEGVDERFVTSCIDEELSIGDYVLSGGELPAMVLIDALTRLLPGALGNEESAASESFVSGLLDHPHYSRPETVDDLSVPEVLLSGDHAMISRWREKQALGRTWSRRPDLLAARELTNKEQKLLDEFRSEYSSGLVSPGGLARTLKNDDGKHEDEQIDRPD